MTGPAKERPLPAQADLAHTAALVARAKQGDRGAFDSLVELYAPQVYNLALRITGSREEAEDCVQEAFVRAYCALRGFRGEAAFSTWLYRVALNVASDAARKRARTPQPASDLAADESEAHQAVLDRLGAQQAPAEVAVIAGQRRQVILQALSRLPEHHRAVVVLCDLQGLSYEEAARVLKARIGTVKSRLSRARLALKDLLTPHLELLRE